MVGGRWLLGPRLGKHEEAEEERQAGGAEEVRHDLVRVRVRVRVKGER